MKTYTYKEAQRRHDSKEPPPWPDEDREEWHQDGEAVVLGAWVKKWNKNDAPQAD